MRSESVGQNVVVVCGDRINGGGIRADRVRPIACTAHSSRARDACGDDLAVACGRLCACGTRVGMQVMGV